MPCQYVMRLSREKALRVSSTWKDAIVLGADTTVVLDDQVMGKPSSAQEATEMLESLRGRAHAVITGVTLLDTSSSACISDATSADVVLRRYSDDEIAAYVASGEPMDKAGAYAVQDTVFKPAIAIQGCYLNVVGLPLCQVVEILDRMGVQARLKEGWQPPSECKSCLLKTGEDATK
jgi:MAF protein